MQNDFEAVVDTKQTMIEQLDDPAFIDRMRGAVGKSHRVLIGSLAEGHYLGPIERQVRTLFGNVRGHINHRYGLAVRSGAQDPAIDPFSTSEQEFGDPTAGTRTIANAERIAAQRCDFGADAEVAEQAFVFAHRTREIAHDQQFLGRHAGTRIPDTQFSRAVDDDGADFHPPTTEVSVHRRLNGVDDQLANYHAAGRALDEPLYDRRFVADLKLRQLQGASPPRSSWATTAQRARQRAVPASARPTFPSRPRRSTRLRPTWPARDFQGSMLSKAL